MARRGDIPPQAREDEQVDHIVKMMLRGEWKGGRSRKLLAAEWGIHERTVGDRAVIASGVLSRRGKPIEDLIDQKYAELEQIQAAAMKHKRAVLVSDGKDAGSHVEYVPDPQFTAAVKAVQTQMEIRGVLTKHRPKETQPGTEGGLEGLLRSVVDDPEMRDKLTAMLAGKAKEMH